MAIFKMVCHTVVWFAPDRKGLGDSRKMQYVPNAQRTAKLQLIKFGVIVLSRISGHPQSLMKHIFAILWSTVTYCTFLKFPSQFLIGVMRARPWQDISLHFIEHIHKFSDLKNKFDHILYSRTVPFINTVKINHRS